MDNLMPDLQDTLDEAMTDTKSYLDSVMAYTAEDQEIYEINLTMLIKARELSKENRLLAKIIFGIQDEEMIAILETATLEDLQRLAGSGLTCFAPRFDTRALRTFMSQPRDDDFGMLLPIIAGMKSDQ